MPARSATKPRIDLSGREDIDSSNLIDPEEASKKFRKAEKRRGISQNLIYLISIFYFSLLDRTQTRYAYPPSPTSLPSPTSPSANSRPVPLTHRLQAIQSELSALEIELADPSNPLLQNGQDDDAVDPGELIRGLVDVRGRLDKIRKDKQGRGKLVGAILGERGDHGTGESHHDKLKRVGGSTLAKIDGKSETRSIVEMDRRVRELENLLGSSSITLDEVLQLSFSPSKHLLYYNNADLPTATTLTPSHHPA